MALALTVNAQWLTNGSDIYYNTGKVSIKTTSPSPANDVNLTINGASINYGVGACVFFAGQYNTTVGYGQYGIEYNEGDGGLNFWKPDGSNGFKNWVLFLKDNGSVGIGTKNLSEGYKLTVAGAIHASKILVSASSGGADFVFEEGFKLMSLNELELYVNNNNHLPCIPSAQEMEETGLDVANFQIKLLQKVEELTLYIIQQQKEIETLKERLPN